MIDKFDKFKGRVKSDLEKSDAIELISIITDLKPSIPELVDNANISKLIDNKVYYDSEDGKYKISVYFRESDEYIDKDGNITYGDFKSLYRISIRKVTDDFKVVDVSEYIDLLCKVVSDTYEDCKIIIKIDNEKINITEFDNNKIIDNLKVIIRIK